MAKKQPSPKVTEAEAPGSEGGKRKKRTPKIVSPDLCLSRDEQAAVHLVAEIGAERASIELGWRYGDLVDCLNQPHVQTYMLEYRNAFIKQMARRRAVSLVKKGITRDGILERAMELASIDPADTRGSVDGQVKALKLCSDIMGLSGDDPLAKKTDEELEAIVAEANSEKLNRTPTTNKVQ
jgi:hypothetical protein